MNQNQLVRLLTTLLRGRGRSQWSLVVVGIVVAYLFLQPILSERFGISAPSFDLPTSQAPSTQREIPTTIKVPGSKTSTPSSNDAGEQTLLDAFEQRKSDVMVEVTATVKKVLPDDNVGSRHQKAILLLPSGHTVLLAHNIDLADKVPFRQGDQIRVCGEYEYTDQGGVIHWTHHDPRRRRRDGWIQFDGVTFK